MNSFSGPSSELDALIAEKIFWMTSEAHVPPYSADLNLAWKVEQAIQDMGLELEYQEALWTVAVKPGSDDIPPGAAIIISYWPIIHATAAQRCLAALRVWGCANLDTI